MFNFIIDSAFNFFFNERNAPSNSRENTPQLPGPSLLEKVQEVLQTTPASLAATTPLRRTPLRATVLEVTPQVDMQSRISRLSISCLQEVMLPNSLDNADMQKYGNLSSDEIQQVEAFLSIVFQEHKIPKNHQAHGRSLQKYVERFMFYREPSSSPFKEVQKNHLAGALYLLNCLSKSINIAPEIHDWIAVAITVTMKTEEDVTFRNIDWAYAALMNTKDFNALEINFLHLIDFKAVEVTEKNQAKPSITENYLQRLENALNRKRKS